MSNNPEIHECYTCGFQWQHGFNGEHDCSLLLKIEREKLRKRVLELELALSFYAGSLREDGNGYEFQKEAFIGQLARKTLSDKK